MQTHGLVTYPNDAEAGHQRLPRALQLVESARDGNIQRTDVAIKLLDEHRQEVMRWNLSRAWPVARGRALNALGNEVAIDARARARGLRTRYACRSTRTLRCPWLDNSDTSSTAQRRR